MPKKKGFKESSLTPEEKDQARLLKAFCKKNRRLQAKVAKRLNVEPGYISQVVAGTRQLTWDIALAFRDESGRALDEFAPLLARRISPSPARIGSSHELAVHDNAAELTKIKGIAKMDKWGFWRIEEQEPGGGFIRRATGDSEAYAIKLVGDALQRKYQSGDYVIVRPSAPLESHRMVYVVLRDGRVTVTQLARRSATETVLRSLVDGSDLTVPNEDIVAMHRIVGQADDTEFVP